MTNSEKLQESLGKKFRDTIPLPMLLSLSQILRQIRQLGQWKQSAKVHLANIASNLKTAYVGSVQFAKKDHQKYCRKVEICINYEVNFSSILQSALKKVLFFQDEYVFKVKFLAN